jgi:hypothetical protein
VVDYSTQNPIIEGSNPATGTGRENYEKNVSVVGNSNVNILIFSFLIEHPSFPGIDQATIVLPVEEVVVHASHEVLVEVENATV